MKRIANNQNLELNITRGEEVVIDGLTDVKKLIGTGKTRTVFIDEYEKKADSRPILISENELSFEGDKSMIIEWTPQYFASEGNPIMLRGLYFKEEKEYEEYNKLLWGNKK